MQLGQLLAIGTGIGIEIGEKTLEAVVARVRPAAIDIVTSASIANFRERPAAEWGAEYARFVKEAGAAHLAATVLIPRREVIARYLALPGVARRDMASAIQFQIDALHPFHEEEAAFAWSPIAQGALVGVVRRDILEHYRALFAEAGIAVAAFTFSAAALHAGRRLPHAPGSGPSGQDGFVTVWQSASGAVEAYGESAARPLFSAEFDAGPERAAALAAAELRLAPDSTPWGLSQVLPAPRRQPAAGEPAPYSLPYAAALAGACPWLTPVTNLLPPEQRSSNSRARLVPSLVLAALLLLVAGGLLAHSALADRRYLASLASEVRRLEPQVRLAASLDREIARAQTRTRLLDEFRGRSKSDLDTLNELTTLLAPPTWTNMLELSRDAVTLNGETEQAAPLLKLLDASPYLQNSAFVGALNRSGGNEGFQIRTSRKARP